ncbi:hypothetical protein AB205_0174850 [Aquarana catesbeiana]|uniref:Translation initiation factor eIF2 assembly protein n=1 Tax=Aquarana catesbeiana TaxID=8400 RepID=A0A2G9RNL8_AQUCT|nr:hypothetical protein AB205_0174850 [Aquarana catesbeiana]
MRSREPRSEAATLHFLIASQRMAAAAAESRAIDRWTPGQLFLTYTETVRDPCFQGKVWIIDFNPFGEVTDSLLFSWEELTTGANPGDEENVDQDHPIFRYTTSEVTVQPSPYLSYRLPKDFVDLSTGEDAHKLIDFLKLKKNQQEEDSDD